MQDVLERLFARRTFGVKLGLDTELAVLDVLGNPHASLAVVHVAGTNGKGSVCALLESICLAAGLKTGLYTSPHLLRFNERFRVAGRDIDDDALASMLERVEAACEKVREDTGIESTFFEAATALAFSHFADQQVDVAIIETGLGGRLDATNVVTPLLSVITRIAMDHTRHLGESLDGIAAEKCGIIKPGRPVISAAQEPQVRDVIAELAGAQGCTCLHVEDSAAVHVKTGSWDGQKCLLETADRSYGTLHLPLLGDHQLENLATAVCTVEQLAEIGLPVNDPKTVAEGVKGVSWRGRCHVIQQEPVMILDGAHNLSAMEALGGTLKGLAKKTKLGLICGFCEDKDVAGCLSCLPGTVRQAWAVPVRSERTMTADAVSEIVTQRGIPCHVSSLLDAIAEAQAWAANGDGVVVITGSLFLVGEVLELIESGKL
jgi:dihydrofolate synthase/folylpolyglutamate synthase